MIEPSNRPYYNSTIFLVMKKNGSKRLVVDFTGINSLIVPKLVQLPQIEELLDAFTAQKPTFLSPIDVTATFWQLKLDQSARDLTTLLVQMDAGGALLVAHLVCRIVPVPSTKS